MTEHPKIQVASDGSLLLNFGSYGGQVEVAAISGDGRRVLTVWEVGTARIWDAQTGIELTCIEPSSPLVGSDDIPFEEFVVFIESAALNHDGSLALLGLNDGTAVIYRVGEAAPLAVLHEDDVPPAAGFGVIRHVRYAGDPELALVGFPRRSVGVWTADGSRRVAWLRADAGEKLVGRPFVRDTLVTALGLSADGKAVFAGAVDMTACVFDLESGRARFDARGHAEDILAVFDGPAGVGWATTAGSVWVASDAGPPQKLLDLGEHWSEVAFDVGSLLARGYDDSIVRWSFEGRRDELSEGRDERGRWSDNASTLALDGERMLYPVSGRRLSIEHADATATVERGAQLVRASFSPTGQLVATEGWIDALELWDAKTGEPRRTLPCPGGIGCSAISAGDQLAAVGQLGNGGGEYPRHIFVYAVESGELLYTLSEHRWQISQLAFSPDGDLLASVGDGLIVWDLRELRVVLRISLSRTVGRFAFAGDLLVACDAGRVQVFERGERVSTFEAPIAFQVPWTISHDGRFISIAHTHGLSRYELRSGALDRRIEPPYQSPERFPPLELAEQHRIFGGAMLWRTEWGCFLHQSDGPRGWIEPLELSPDNLAVVRREHDAAVLELRERSTLVRGFVPFTGRMRASRIVNGEVLALDEQGRLFRTPLPAINPAAWD